MLMWQVNLKSLEAQSVLGGPDLKPFYGLIDGGRDGEFFKEMRELFYYSQLRHHGLAENTDRVIKTTIPLSEIPYVMRGLGFYPTEQEIEEMINEVKFGQYIDTNEFVDSINLDDFIRLYINHRPAFGIDPYQIYNAFKVNYILPKITFQICFQNITKNVEKFCGIFCSIFWPGSHPVFLDLSKNLRKFLDIFKHINLTNMKNWD